MIERAVNERAAVGQSRGEAILRRAMRERGVPEDEIKRLLHERRENTARSGQPMEVVDDD